MRVTPTQYFESLETPSHDFVEIVSTWWVPVLIGLALGMGIALLMKK